MQAHQHQDHQLIQQSSQRQLQQTQAVHATLQSQLLQQQSSQESPVKINLVQQPVLPPVPPVTVAHMFPTGTRTTPAPSSTAQRRQPVTNPYRPVRNPHSTSWSTRSEPNRLHGKVRKTGFLALPLELENFCNV